MPSSQWVSGWLIGQRVNAYSIRWMEMLAHPRYLLGNKIVTCPNPPETGKCTFAEAQVCVPNIWNRPRCKSLSFVKNGDLQQGSGQNAHGFGTRKHVKAGLLSCKMMCALQQSRMKILVERYPVALPGYDQGPIGSLDFLANLPTQIILFSSSNPALLMRRREMQPSALSL